MVLLRQSVTLQYQPDTGSLVSLPLGSAFTPVGSGFPTIQVNPAPNPSPNNPNEPAGYARFAEYDFTTELIHGIGISNGTELAGCCWKFAANNFFVTQDPTAPFSPNNVIDVVMPQGLSDGNGPGTYKLWDLCSETNNTEYSKIYMHTRIKLAGGPNGDLPDWECHPVLTKWLGFWGTGRNNSGGGPFELIGSIIGNGVAGQADTDFRFHITQAFTASRNLNPNRNVSQSRIFVQQWHDIEMVQEQGSGPGVPDGLFRLWLDGVLVMEYFDVVYFTNQWPSGFWGRHYNPTWGGISGLGSKQRTDHIYIDHEYISGVLK